MPALLIPVILTIFLMLIFYYDLTSYLIPNWINGLLLVLYPIFLLMSPPFPPIFNAWISLLIFGIVFAVGIAIFMFRWAGGGDVKLLAVLSLWTGKEAIIPF